MTNRVDSEIIFQAIKKKIATREEFDRLKRQIAGSFKLPPPPTSSLTKAYHTLLNDKKIRPCPALEAILVRRAVRSLSGISPVTVLTKPFPCPGRCVYCPTEATMPKSYLSNEPAAMRALYLNFNPYWQVSRRLQAMRENGHPVDKIELIIKGGSWTYYPWTYQKWFVKRCFDAANDFGNKKSKSATLARSQRINETAGSRIIGLTLETRPDFIDQIQIKKLRELGCTRVELGVQILDDKILKLIKRGHLADAVIQATRLLKDAGFKVDYHMMPGLPGSTPAKDIKNFKMLFSDQRFRPDMIKIYPCVLLPNSELYDWWKKGKYNPPSERVMIRTLAKIKMLVPRYVRISRLFRDFPSSSISHGIKISNLRQYVLKEMEKTGKTCQCLRCREIGHHPEIDSSKIKPRLFIDKYRASDGTEYFLSFEDANRRFVFGFLRLRLSSFDTEKHALIRELHVYGQELAIGKIKKQAPQHRGLGKKLMHQAEALAKKNGCQKISVISGVGVRDYYRKLGYRLKNTYMIKKIR